ncbi:MAG: 4-hydroxy-tetrahydrodipicolinate synthase [Clostridia bacterium]
MKKTIFQGAGVAIVTPFNKDLSVNFDQLKNLIEFQINSGTDAIISCGTTGEASTLSEKEHIEVLEFTAKTIDGRIPLIASAGSNDTAFAIELAKESEKIGADGLLLITPYYNKTSQKGLIESFTKIADSTNVPAVLYNVPSRTGVNILPETYAVLSKHKNIVATKEANHDISSVAKSMSLCGDDLAFYSGEDDQVMPMMALGGKGVISVFSNIMPSEMKALCDAMLNNDYAKARNLVFKNIKLMSALFSDVNPIPVKEALSLMGYCNNTCRLPLTTMEEKDALKLAEVLKEYSLI